MPYFREDIQCPRCGYEAARRERHVEGRPQSVICIRCGYSNEHFFNREKHESMRKDSLEKEDEQQKLRKQCWEWEVIYPTGSYICRCKGEDMYTVGSIEDGTIENLLEHLDEYDVCKYTFYKVRSWYIKDLHSNTTTFFSIDEYHKCRTDLTV